MESEVSEVSRLQPSEENPVGKRPGLLRRAASGFRRHVVLGTRDTLRTILRGRRHRMRPLILVQLVQYACSFFTYAYLYMIYLYMM